MPVRLSVHLPTWGSDLAVRRLRADLSTRPGAPGYVLLTRVDHQRDVVASCCAAAASAGVVPGMTVAHARALLGPEGVHLQAADPAGAARALRHLARWMLRAVPVVAVDEPDGLWLDASGCERLYPDPVRLGRRIVVTLARFGVAARVGIAPTWGAAWALARFGPRRVSVADPSCLTAALDAMPTAALRIEPGAADALATVGVERVGQLRALPRRSLGDRYGEGLLLRLDQALGQAVEVIAPVHPPEPVCVEWLLDGPTDRIEDIELAVQELIGQAAALLHERESGCRTLELVLRRSDLPPLTLAVNTSRPTRDGGHLWAMMRPRLETAQLGFGVEGVRVRALGIETMPHTQAGVWAGVGAVAGFDGGSACGADDVGRLVDTLSARLGRERVVRLCPVQSHLPERMAAYEPIERLDGPATRGGRVALREADRPSLVLSRPVPVEPTLLVPDGPIAALRSGGKHHRIIATVGPERIGGEWWRDRRPARDYFKVQTERGRWLWVFREVTGGPGAPWFLHGEWA